MMSFKIIGDFLVSCAVHGGILAAAFAVSNTCPALPQEKVYRVSLAHVAMPATANDGKVSSVSMPDPPTPAPVMETRHEKAMERPQAPRPPKPVSPRGKKVSPKPRMKETPVQHAAAESLAASAGGMSPDAGPPLRMGGFAAYGEDAVDRPPSLSLQIAPEYPQRARRMNVEGRVEVRLVVDSAGKPQACVVHNADPAGYFEEAALTAARKTRFIPGALQGKPVNTLVHISFVFVLR